MIDVRPLLLVIGILLTLLGVAMLLPAGIDLILNNPDWQVFFAAASLTTFIGMSLALTNWGYTTILNLQQAFLLTISSWVVLAAFAALPFAFAGLELSYTDAFFEAMSGLTTTGSTVMTNLDGTPPGILLWRALLQWLGGVGIIVMAVGLLPILQVGGMQLFRVEAFDTPEKVLPSAARFAASLGALYVSMTLACGLALIAAGIGPFDAVTHAMTTIATGGFSTHDRSVGYFDNAVVDWIIIGGMIAGSLPFALYLQALQGKRDRIWRDVQVRIFFVAVAMLVAAMTFYLWYTDVYRGFDNLRYAAFNVISVMTGTGYSTQDYNQWGPFAVMMLFWVMFIGGCAGSTSCGIKIFRFHVIVAAVVGHVRRMLHPHGVFVFHYNDRPIDPSVTASVMSFFFLFFVSIAVLTFLLGLLGLDFITALSAAATAIANVGPGLGPEVGPAGTFQNLPDAAKWLMSFGMLLGRLELFTVLIIFTPSFWQS